jgi:uncharacterized membrane protein YkvA (DUF1232 family)
MDLIPDWIPLLGLLDDSIAMLVMAAGFLLVTVGLIFMSA